MSSSSRPFYRRSVGHVSPHVRESKTVLDSGFHAVDFGFQLLDSSLCRWNLDSGFQSLVGFRIPWPEFQIPKRRIPDSPTQISPDSEPHKQKYPGFQNLLHEATRWKNNLKDEYPIPGRERTRVCDSRETRSFLDEFPKILSHV